MTVSEASRLITTAAAMVSANSRSIRPITPPMKISGTKTASRLSEMVSTVNPTSRAPFSAAGIGRIPSSTWRAIFSTTTIASSTTKPVETVSAISERLSSRKPDRYITPSVPASEASTAAAGIAVARQLCRNRLTTTTTSSVETSSGW